MPADQLHDRLQSSLAPSYTLGRELGGGGMSRVFLATETRLGRDVVVKVLDPEVASGLSAERFAREVQLAARLQHPHVVPVLSAGEAGGMPYYTMPFVRGESLRDRLARGPLPVAEVVRVLAGVARALSYAHRNAIVHRDIKPDNVLLPDGIAVVTDFGIAKAIAVAAGGGRAPVHRTGSDVNALHARALTQLGMAVGTPAYVAPEQASGDPDTDHRADIYAWGVLAYELLAGAAPFAGRTPQATILAHFTEAPPPLESRRPDAPPALAALILRCLAKEPARRPQSADELLAVLEGDPAALPAPTATPASLPELPSVAVLPFASLSTDPDAELFADGVTDEVITALSQLGTLRVPGSVSSFAFKGERPPLPELAARLRVSNVVSGSVRRAGARVRITVQLVSAADGFQLWSERFDRELLDVFEVQDEIARAVANALRAKLLTPPAAAAARHRPTESVEAYELYLRGRHLWTSRVTGVMVALAHFERAVTLDANFAHAHAGIADAYLAGGVYGLVHPRDAMAPSLAAAERALALGPDLAESHASRGGIALFFEHDVPRAQHHLERALALNPGYIPAMQWLGTLHLGQRRAAEVRRLMRHALEVEPLSAGPHAHFGTLLFMLGQVEEGEALVRRAVELDPSYALADYMLAFMRTKRGDAAAGIAAAERFHVATRGSALATAMRAGVYAAAGRREEAERDVADLLARDPATPIPHSLVAVACVQLGDRARAYEQLEAALASPDVALPYMGVDSWPAPLRGEPRFEAILARLGLPPSLAAAR